MKKTLSGSCVPNILISTKHECNAESMFCKHVIVLGGTW